MPAATAQAGLPRRIVACYLLFAVVAIGWLTVGLVVTAYGVLTSRTLDSAMLRLGRAAAQAQIAHTRGDREQLQPIVVALARECGAPFAAIVDAGSKVLAHSDAARVGESFAAPAGTCAQWGDVTGVQFADTDGRPMQLYRCPLQNAGQPVGEILLEVPLPDLRSTALTTAMVAPWAVLVPLVVVLLGALVLRRMARPMEAIAVQLTRAARAADGQPLELSPVTGRDSAVAGYNYLVELLAELQRTAQGASLEDRLAVAIASRRDTVSDGVLNSLLDGVAVTDAEGRVRFANDAIAALLADDEQTIESLAGTRFAELLASRARNTSALTNLEITPALRPALAELACGNAGETRMLRVARQPLRGRPSGEYVWSVRDITQQKMAEAMRDQFIDSATHELRTPLANLKAYAETLATSEFADVEEQKEFCSIINSEATRLARLVDDLLSVSSMEVGSLVISRQNVLIERLLTEVADNVRPLMDSKSLKFKVVLPPKLGEARIDKDKFAATLVNLLGNAAKYTPEGGEVAFRAKIEGRMLVVDIEDSGVGIAADDLPYVFDKFFRSNDPRVQNETGTGLGLSLASEVVRLHGGEITVRSELNRGSTFTVQLPLEGGTA